MFYVYIRRSKVMAVMHGFTLSVLVSPLKTQKPPPLISTAWTAVLDLKILCNYIGMYLIIS